MDLQGSGGGQEGGGSEELSSSGLQARHSHQFSGSLPRITKFQAFYNSRSSVFAFSQAVLAGNVEFSGSRM